MSLRLLFTATVLSFMSLQVTAAGVQGVWASPADEETKGHIEVEVMPCAGDADLSCGVITGYFKNGVPTDSDIVGKPIIKNMRNVSDTLWKGGTIWAPDDDKTYSAKMELLDENTLKVSGCVLRFICRGQNWTRVQAK